MHGDALAVFALLMFSGLLRPLDRSARFKPDRAKHPDPAANSATGLNAIELALVAELNLERARAHEEVANDVAQRPEARRSAAAAAAAWRDRARLFQLEAQRRTAYPMTPDAHPVRVPATCYEGPERRRQARRTQTRRVDLSPVGDPVDERDRRNGPERRGGDRRRPQLAPR